MTEFQEQQPDGHGPPWGWQPSLEQMTGEAGIDFDRFMELLEQQVTDEEIAAAFQVSPLTVKNLRAHFEAFGIDSVHGQD